MHVIPAHRTVSVSGKHPHSRAFLEWTVANVFPPMTAFVHWDQIASECGWFSACGLCLLKIHCVRHYDCALLTLHHLSQR